MPETMGSGCGFFDFDGDGDADVLLLNGTDFSHKGGSTAHTPALFRNDSGRFVNVTAEVGLAVPLYAIGCAAGDYDADGDLDLCITGVESTRLFRNTKGRFTDVTRSAGLECPGWSSGVAWLDFDHDGHLDLYIARYIKWSPRTDQYCTLTGKRKSYCTPQDYDGLSCQLYRNQGDGTFSDVSVKAGIASHIGKSLGVLALDGDEDGWTDVFVANDTEPNFLFRNQRDGTFREVALKSGTALGDGGRPRAGMGVAAADINGSGQPAIAVTNFAGEGLSLFVGSLSGLYDDEANRRGLLPASSPLLGFGLCFLDGNLDGRQDLLVANGHVHDDIEEFQPEQRHSQVPLLLLNYAGRFVVNPSPPGAAFRPMVGRGAATADFDRDGRTDVLLSANGGEPRLLRNVTEQSGSWLRLDLLDATGAAAIGAKVEVRAGGQTQVQWVGQNPSYCSQSEMPLTYRLNPPSGSVSIRVRWPSGRTQDRSEIPLDRAVTLREQ